MKLQIQCSVIGIILITAFGSGAFAQPSRRAAAPATLPAPATTATTTPARHEMIMPPGFKKIEGGGHTLLVQPQDEAWAAKALENLEPTTLPTTMPGDVASTLANKRDELIKQISTDLALADRGAVTKFIDDDLLAAAKTIDEMNPPFFYLVTTQEKVKELLKGGWTDPRFYYNRAGDFVQFDHEFSPARAKDDVVIPAVYPVNATDGQKAAALNQAIHQSEGGLAQLVSNETFQYLSDSFFGFVANEGFAPLHLSRGQQWLGSGAATVLSMRYTSMGTGISLDQLYTIATADEPENPVRASTIDLINPPDPATLRTAAIPAFSRAYQRKSARVVLNWMNRAGDSALPKLLTEFRKNPPADGAALVKLIQQTSGIDLTAELSK